MTAVDALGEALSGMARPTLSDLQALFTELGTATGPGKEWGRIDGDTFVAATRDVGDQAIVGSTGGWRTIRVPEDGPTVVSEPYLTAAEAVRSLRVVEP